MVLPEEQHPVNSKWVFTIKWNPDETLERFKTHLVNREFMQQYGVNYTETFTPTVQMITLCAFFSIATAGKDSADLDWFFAQLTGHFIAKDLGEIKQFLGI